MANLIGFGSPLKRARQSAPRASWASLVLRVVWGSAVAAALTTASIDAAHAQPEWVNPDVIALREDVRRLEAEISALRAGAPSPTDSGLGGDFFLRLERLEGQVRGLTGRIEQLEFSQRRGDQGGRARMDALDQRVGAIEGRLGIAPSGPLAAAPGRGEDFSAAAPETFPAPVPAPDLSYSASGAQLLDQRAGASFGEDYSAGVEVDEQGRPVSPGAGSFATEPDSLGTIPSSGSAVAGVPQGGEPPQQTATSFTARSGDADADFNAALELVRSGKFDDAERSFRDFIDNYPNDARIGEAKYWFGETHYLRSEFAEAARIFLDAFRQHPQSDRAPDSVLRLGMTLAELGQPEQACLTFAEVLSRFPNASATVLRRARVEADRYRCQ